MRKVSVVGIGAGDPEQLTLQAVRVLGAADVVFLVDKGGRTRELTDLKREICAPHLTSGRFVTAGDPDRDRTATAYRDAVGDWRRQRAEILAQLIAGELGEDGHGVIPVWGDPSLYDGTLAMLDHIRASGGVQFDVDVVPGVTSIQALAARHGTTLTRTGRPVQVTTGRLLADGYPQGVDDVVVMLDPECRFAELAGTDLEIYWGAYVGTGDELLASGKVSEVADDIVATRDAARQRHGWVMDSYLLRRPEAPS